MCRSAPKKTGSRDSKIAVPPAHELLDEEVLNTSSMTDVIAASVRDNEWSPLYTNHVVALQARARNEVRPIIPIVLYVDGVPYSTTDSVVGLWAYNAATEVRHLLALLKKATSALAVAEGGVRTTRCFHF